MRISWVGDSVKTDLAEFLLKLGWTGQGPKSRPSGKEGSEEVDKNESRGVFVTILWYLADVSLN
jgi:hypothetical protein